MASRLSKYADQVGEGDDRYFWSRADVDGAPFRGPAPPILPEAEYDARVVKVADFRHDSFDMADAEKSRAYDRVMDCIMNGRYSLVFISRFHNGTNVHYVEWNEHYMQDSEPSTRRNGAV